MAAPSYPPDLPITARRDEILAAIRAHQVVIIAGETGSGKTTQLPKMCLEAGLDARGRIGCTQPRRVAAMSVSRRVAEELGVTWGREVGCKMRFNDDTGRDTRIKFMTDGILLAEIQSDPSLRAYSTLILDEAHERSLNIDFLLGYLQGLLKRRPDLKLLVTSATIDTAAFSAAFGGAPVIEVSGRMFPVEIRYAPLDSFAAVADPSQPKRIDEVSAVDAAVRAVEEALIETDSGDVLVFMPTERDIRETRELLENSLGAGIEVLGLFGRLSGAEQQRIFTPGGKRRVIVATNIAETSLTIPRITTVIDSGLARISRYNARTRTKRLPVEEISQSSANQRAGRAGRLCPGLCIRLYAQDDFEKRPRFTQPEIQRANLAEVILRMKAFQLGEVENFPFLSPPHSQAIRAGYQLLQELGALTQSDGATTEGNVLTPLGRELARLPLDPTLGRMLLQACTEGALPEMLIIAAGLSIPDPRERPEEEKEAAAAAHRAFTDADSDFLTLLKIWRAAPDPDARGNALRRFCKANFLSQARMREWRDVHFQLSQTLEDRLQPRRQRNERPAAGNPPTLPAQGADPARGANPAKAAQAVGAGESVEVTQAIHRSILTGLLGQIGHRQDRNVYKSTGDRLVTLFPGSGLYERNVKKPKADPGEKPAPGGSPKAGPRQPLWIVAGELVQTSQLFARTVARIDPQWVVELGAHLCKFRYALPQWSAKAGRVLVWERVLLSGLELAKRQVDFGRIDPVVATEIFIREALVAGGAAIPHRFFAANQRLREKIETALTRVRSHRVQDLDEAFYAFYAARIQNVSSLHDLNRLVRDTAEADFLCATEADLLGDQEIGYDRHLFPDQVALGNAVIPLSYTYDPGSESDGVTLRVPLPVAEGLTTGQLHGLVPGLRREQIGALIRSLPKTVRKQLMPLEPKIAELLQDFQPGKADMLTALGEFIGRRYGVRISPEDWKSLPDYLRPRVEVIDQNNRTLASGRDLEKVRATMESSGARSDGWTQAVRRYEKTALPDWTIGECPESVIVELVAGAPVLAYPGLSWEGNGAGGGTVNLRLFRKKEQAMEVSVEGIRRLGELVLAREVSWLGRELRALPLSGGTLKDGSGRSLSPADTLNLLGRKLQNKAGAGQPGRTHEESFPATALAHIFDHLLRLEPLLPLSERAFRAMLEAARRELPGLTYRVKDLTKQILTLCERIMASRSRYPGMEEDVARLAGPGFLAVTPHAQLPHLLRYLRAVQIRAERATLNPAKDAEKASLLVPFAKWKTTVPAPRQEEFRWLLEEYRVSVFAQELGTAQPASIQRLKALGAG